VPNVSQIRILLFLTLMLVSSALSQVQARGAPDGLR
jgi:hypothetical protein